MKRAFIETTYRSLRDAFHASQARLIAPLLEKRGWSTAAALASAAILAGLFALKVAIIFGAFLPPGETRWWGIHQFSDFLSMLGGKRFAEEGFLEHYLLMNTTVGPHELARGWQYYQVPQLTYNSAIYYTHYGSLDAILTGMVFKLTGSYSLKLLYLLFSVFSFVCLGLWAIAARMLFGSLVSLVSIILIAPSVFFFTVAGSPTAESLSWSLTFLALAAFVFAERAAVSRRIKWGLYGVVWVCGFLQSNNNPQFVPLIAIFLASYALLYWRFSWRNVAICALLISSLGVGYLVHAALVSWALGGWQNFLADVVAALNRRTEGFAEGVEIAYRQFRVGEAPVYLARFLNEMQALRWWRWIAMIALPPLLVLMAQAGDMKERIREWALGVAILVGGLAFVIVFVQAAVTQPLDILKTLMLGAGVLLGLCLREALALFRSRRFVPALLAIGMGSWVAGPAISFNVTGRSITKALQGSAIKGGGRHYFGASPDEILRVGRFLKGHTKYGDVIFAGFRTGETGHPDYPNPAWEFLSDRQIHVLNGVEDWSKSIAQLQRRVDSFPKGSAIRATRFFTLMGDDIAAAPALGRYLSETARAVARLDADPAIPSSVGYTLYLINSRTADLPRNFLAGGAYRENPSTSTPWTGILNVKSRLESIVRVEFEGGWVLNSLSQMPSIFHRKRTGLLHFYSGKEKPTNLRNSVTKFRSQVGSTLEARFWVDQLLRPDPDAAIISLMDGEYELKGSFSGNELTIRSQTAHIATLALPAMMEPVVLRLAIVAGRAYVYLNGLAYIKGVFLDRSEKPDNGVLLGHFSRDGNQIGSFELDYLAYSNQGAFTPEGRNLADDAEYIATAKTPWTASNARAEGWIARGVEYTYDGLIFVSARQRLASHVERDVPDFDNSKGSTFEVSATIGGRTIQDRLGALMLLRDGERELSISFFQDHIRVFDGNEEISRLAYDDEPLIPNTYRLAIIGDCGYVFINGRSSFGGMLRMVDRRKGAQFGDFIPHGERNFRAQVNRLSVSSKGAFSPDGRHLGTSVAPDGRCAGQSR